MENFVNRDFAPEFRNSPANFSNERFLDIFKSIIFCWCAVGIVLCGHHENWIADGGEIQLFSTQQ